MLPKFFYSGLPADLPSEVVEFRLPDLTLPDDVNPIDPGRVQWECLLYADAMTDTPDRERLPHSPTLPCDDGPFKSLDALPAPFEHFVVHAEGVAGREHGKLGFDLLKFDAYGGLHALGLLRTSLPGVKYSIAS